MSEQTQPDTGTETTDTTDTGTTVETPAAGDTPDLSAELEKWKAQARKHEERAKANAAAAKELETVKAASMSEQEKAVAEAKAAGRAEALTEAGAKIARAEFKAAAKDRIDTEGLDALMESLDLNAFLDEAGDVDAAKITALIDRIAPAASDEEEKAGDLLAGLDLGQGTRSKVPGLGSTQLERDLRASLGIR